MREGKRKEKKMKGGEEKAREREGERVPQPGNRPPVSRRGKIPPSPLPVVSALIYCPPLPEAVCVCCQEREREREFGLRQRSHSLLLSQEADP